MLVMEARALGEMALELDGIAEAQAWVSEAADRADRINERMWDEETGFYYHVGRDSDSFTFDSENDLKRMEIRCYGRQRLHAELCLEFDGCPHDVALVGPMTVFDYSEIRRASTT